MAGPARGGVFLYAKELERVARFYETILGMVRLHATAEIVVLESPDLQLVVHAVPTEIASTIVITNPPERRERTALKFFFTVASLMGARAAAPSLGGEVLVEEWQGQGFRACNAVDPEGNIFQLRESAS